MSGSSSDRFAEEIAKAVIAKRGTTAATPPPRPAKRDRAAERKRSREYDVERKAEQARIDREREQPFDELRGLTEAFMAWARKHNVSTTDRIGGWFRPGWVLLDHTIEEDISYRIDPDAWSRPNGNIAKHLFYLAVTPSDRIYTRDYRGPNHYKYRVIERFSQLRLNSYNMKYLPQLSQPTKDRIARIVVESGKAWP